MNKEEAKELLPVIQAFAEGKSIEVRNCAIDDEWKETSCPSFGPPFDYRIKPEPKYRPFKDTDECWNEMLKHQPFGWVRKKETNSMFIVKAILNNRGYYDVHIGCNKYHFDEVFTRFTFIDGAPFGIKEGGDE